MTKIMLMTVTGGDSDLSVGPWRRIVSVEDELEFIAQMRIFALQEIKQELAKDPSPVDDDIQAAILRSLKIRLTDTGLTEYPESHAEQAALYERMTKGDDGNNDSDPGPSLGGRPNVQGVLPSDSGNGESDVDEPLQIR